MSRSRERSVARSDVAIRRSRCEGEPKPRAERGGKRRGNPTESSRGAQLRGDLIKLNEIATPFGLAMTKWRPRSLRSLAMTL
jgi:hypothetical protein